MSLWLAVCAALGCSACGALASTLQHRTAMAVAVVGARPAHAVRATLTHRWWLVAVALQGLGFLLHATALRFGQLTIVQPLLVCAVLFALPLNRLLRRERITRAELGWATLLVLALAGFLVVAAPPGGQTTQPIDVGPAILAGIAGLAAVVGCALCASRWYSRVGPAVLGTAAGILFAAQAALLKSSVGVLGDGPIALLTTWQPYALLLVGGTAVVFSQLAFRSGPLSASLPVVTTVNPVLGVLVGATVYDESVRYSPPALVAEALFLLLLVLATVVLARLENPGVVTTAAATTPGD